MPIRLSNAASSGYVYKVNTILVSNTDGTNPYNISINKYSAAALGGTAYSLASTISVPANSTLAILEDWAKAEKAINAAVAKATAKTKVKGAKLLAPILAYTADDKTLLGTGELITADNAVDAQTGTIKLKGQFPNAAHQLWPGGFVTVRLRVDTLRDVLGVRSADEATGRRRWTLRAAMQRIAREGSGVIVILREVETPRELADAERENEDREEADPVVGGGAAEPRLLERRRVRVVRRDDCAAQELLLGVEHDLFRRGQIGLDIDIARRWTVGGCDDAP